MRRLVFAVSAPLLIAGSAYAQNPDRVAIEKAIIANEQAVSEAVAKHDLATFKKHVASDGWSVDPGGPMPVTEFEKVFNQVTTEPGWKITGSKVMWIDNDAAVHVYRWSGKGTFNGQPFGDTHSSTVWAKRGATWQAIFHQETPAAPAPKK